MMRCPPIWAKRPPKYIDLLGAISDEGLCDVGFRC